ncbi:MAG: hypothetical protein JWO32_275 [Bacteroidetes bacterium]|nr:hypothetical protein [Bacteroidota bacterium]
MFKSITPKFINQLDTYLLRNHPVLWMSKIHYAIWHGALLWIISAVLGYIIPINLKGNIEYGLWYFLFTVLGLVILCFWIYRFVIFNKEKDYGSKKFSDEYKNFILVFFATAIFLLVPWPFEMIYNQRVAALYTDGEVLQDINTLNERDPYLANSTNYYYSWYDSITKVQYFNVRHLNPVGGNYYTPYYLRSDSAKYPGLLTDFQLYKQYKPITDISVLQRKIEEFIVVAEKYNCRVNESAKVIAERYLSLLARDKIPTSEFYGYSYHYELSTIFNNLCEAKFKTLFIFSIDYLWVMFYVIISIVAFLLLFKITGWKQYLITLVVLLLYPLIMFIFSQLVPYSNTIRGSTFFETSMLALIIFSMVSLFVTIKNNRCFKPFYNVLNQLFYITLIYSPLLVVLFLHDNTNVFHYSNYWNYDRGHDGEQATSIVTQYDAQLSNLNYQYWAEEYNRWITLMKYFGIGVFIFTLPLFKNLFVKQISLPRKY